VEDGHAAGEAILVVAALPVQLGGGDARSPPAPPGSGCGGRRPGPGAARWPGQRRGGPGRCGRRAALGFLARVAGDQLGQAAALVGHGLQLTQDGVEVTASGVPLGETIRSGTRRGRTVRVPGGAVKGFAGRSTPLSSPPCKLGCRHVSLIFSRAREAHTHTGQASVCERHKRR
jgi:hypothetical protein